MRRTDWVYVRCGRHSPLVSPRRPNTYIDSGFARKFEYEEAGDDMTVGYWHVVERD